jgi:hypothetical protein
MPQRLDGFYSDSVFRSLFVIGPWPVNMNIPAWKNHNGPTRNFNFLQPDLTCPTDFTVVWYSATNNGPLYNNQFSLQCNVMKVNCKYMQCFYNDLFCSCWGMILQCKWISINNFTLLLLFSGSTALVGLGRLFSPLIYTQSIGLLGLVISLSQGHYLHTGQYKQNKCRQTSMPWVGFEPTVLAF